MAATKASTARTDKRLRPGSNLTDTAAGTTPIGGTLKANVTGGGGAGHAPSMDAKVASLSMPSAGSALPSPNDTIASIAGVSLPTQ